MNIKLYNAAITQLRAEALESLALIELLLTNPTVVPDHSSLVTEISKQSRQLAQCEGAMHTLQQYFAPKAPPAPQAAPPPAPPGPPAHTVSSISQQELEKRSATMRKAMAAKKQKEERLLKRKAAAAKKKKEETNEN